MKPMLILLFLAMSTGCLFAQSDMLVMKQRDRTIQTWFAGDVISFQFSSRQWIQGIIRNIRNDSIVMTLFRLERVPNMFGFLSIDTVKLGLMKMHIKEIYGMPKKNRGGNIFTTGGLYMLGSAAYIFLNLFNTIIHKDPLFESPNGTRLGVAAGVFAFGVLLQSTHKDYVLMGKKYTMQTIQTGK